MPTNEIVPVGSLAALDPALLAGQLAPSSIAKYRQDWGAYLGWCAAGDVAPGVPASLARYRAHLAGSTRLAPSTINRRLAAVKRITREAAEQGYLDAEVAARFGLIKGVAAKALKGRGRAHARTRISPADMRRLCDAPDASTPAGLRDRALLALLASSGVRLAEACGVRQSDVHAVAGGYVVSVIGKGRSEARDAPLSAEAWERIGAWLTAREIICGIKCAPNAAIFTSQAGRGGRWTDRPISPAGGWGIVKVYAGICGLEFVKPHDLRRFVGTQLAAKDIRLAQKALGHSRLDTTAKHYVLDDLAAGVTEGLY